MRYYVIRAKRRKYETHLPDWRTAVFCSGHSDRDTADLMVTGFREQDRSARLYGVYADDELPKRLREQIRM